MCVFWPSSVAALSAKYRLATAKGNAEFRNNPRIRDVSWKLSRLCFELTLTESLDKMLRLLQPSGRSDFMYIASVSWHHMNDGSSPWNQNNIMTCKVAVHGWFCSLALLCVSWLWCLWGGVTCPVEWLWTQSPHFSVLPFHLMHHHSSMSGMKLLLMEQVGKKKPPNKQNLGFFR